MNQAFSEKPKPGQAQPAHHVKQASLLISPLAALIDAVINATTRSLSVCPQHEIRGAEQGEPSVEHIQPGDHAVVREDPGVLQERNAYCAQPDCPSTRSAHAR